MLRDCWSWCWRKRTRKMILESSDWQRVDVGDLSRFSEEVQVVVNQCTERVNCVADCFVNASANVNIAYIKKDALPRGIGRGLSMRPGIKDRPVWKPTGVKSMLRDCWSWCWRKRTRKMILESSDWQRVDVGDLSRFSEEVQVVVNQCTERVNCVADCFVNASANVNIAYIKKDALPRGIGRVLALEGVPHFVFVPGLDFA
nr:uncharacterized protein LOC109147873 [Ipomoea batatas]